MSLPPPPFVQAVLSVFHVRMEEEPQSYYRINGLNSVYLSITAEETANQLQLDVYKRQGLENAESYSMADDALKEGDTVIVTGNVNLAHEASVKVVDR